MVATQDIEKCVLDKLFQVLKGWSDDMDAFRYEMFARRLIAAEYGRPDAVEWAQAWYNDVVADEKRIAEEKERSILEREERMALDRAELAAGRCGNPNYQAFLDTVEQPGQITSNQPYFAWLSELRVVFEQTPGLRGMTKTQKRDLWRKMIEDKRDANLAPRMRSTLH